MAKKKKILVPVKPAHNHNEAVDTAILFAKDLCADIHFISILPLDSTQILEEQVIANLSPKIKICSKNKISATYELAKTDGGDKIGEELAKIAEKFDLIIIGHTQYEQIYRFLHRSPTVDLINIISKVPVIVVPDESKPMKKA